MKFISEKSDYLKFGMRSTSVKMKTVHSTVSGEHIEWLQLHHTG